MILPRKLTVSALILMTLPVMCMVSSNVEFGRPNRGFSRVSFVDPSGRSDLIGGALFFGTFSGAAPWRTTRLEMVHRSRYRNAGGSGFVSLNNGMGGRITLSAAREYGEQPAATSVEDSSSSIPEPATLALVGTGVAGIFASRCKNCRKKS